MYIASIRRIGAYEGFGAAKYYYCIFDIPFMPLTEMRKIQLQFIMPIELGGRMLTFVADQIEREIVKTQYAWSWQTNKGLFYLYGVHCVSQHMNEFEMDVFMGL